MIWEDILLMALAIVIGLVVVFAPTPGIDCRNYHQDDFYGVRVHCGGDK